MTGTPMSLYASFFSWVWQNPLMAPQLIELLRCLAKSEKLEEFIQVMIAVAGHEMNVREAGNETDEILRPDRAVA